MRFIMLASVTAENAHAVLTTILVKKKVSSKQFHLFPKMSRDRMLRFDNTTTFQIKRGQKRLSDLVTRCCCLFHELTFMFLDK